MVLTKDSGYVRTITLNRPEAMNAFNGQQFDELTEALLAARDDAAVRVVVLTGAGRAFSTGLDLSEVGKDMEPPKHGVPGLFNTLVDFPKPLLLASNGFGPLGPDADRPMVEGAVQARGGLASVCGPADSLPMPAGATIADGAGALQFALGIVTALLAKERHGVGQTVNTSSLGTQIWLQSWEIQQCLLTDKPLHRAGSHMPDIRGPYGVYAASDGGAFLFTLVGDSAWQTFCEYGGLPDLADNPLRDNAVKRMGAIPDEQDDAAVDRVRADMAEIFASHTSEEWNEFFRARDDVIVEKIQSHAEVVTDAQTVANEYVVPMVFAGVGESRVVGNHVQLSETPGSVKGAPPELGNSTRDVMLALGYSEEEIDATEEHTAHIRNKTMGA